MAGVTWAFGVSVRNRRGADAWHGARRGSGDAVRSSIRTTSRVSA
jgi:hypothetical protein